MKNDDRPIPTPPRPLDVAGRAMWEAVHAVGEVRGNLEPFMRVCEQLDERAELRQRVVTDQDWRDRIGLRALDAQIGDALADLGIRSTLPAARIVKDNDWTVELASVIGPGGTDHLTASRDE